MKKIIIPLLTAAVVVAICFAGCMPGAPEVPGPVAPPPVAPPPVTPPPVTPPPVTPPAAALTAADIPELQELIQKGALDPNLSMNPFGEDFALKPDGTPYHFAVSPCFLRCDWCQASNGVMVDLLERAGAKVTWSDPEFVPDVQIAFVEDCYSVIKPDAILIQPVTAAAESESMNRATDAGIPVFIFDHGPAPTDMELWKFVSYVEHPFETEIGSKVVGDWFVQKAEETGEHIYLLEVWGDRSERSGCERHVGMHLAFAESPGLVTVIETADSYYDAANTTNIVMDEFTSRPELNALFNMDGGGAGCLAGLEAIDRLHPIGDPEHVYCCFHGCDVRVVEEMLAGNLDAFGTHGGWDLADVCVKTALTYVVLGQPVPKNVVIAMTVVTADTLYTERLLGGPAAYALMPMGQWELWPVLDSSLGQACMDINLNPIAVETPTKEMRMELLGY